LELCSREIATKNSTQHLSSTHLELQMGLWNLS
jgi:hypothetical protein